MVVLGPLFTVLIKENEVIQVKTTQANRPQFTGWPVSQELFASPPRDFRPATYWFWSREVDTSAFRAQLEEMKARVFIVCGFNQGLVFPWRNSCPLSISSSIDKPSKWQLN